MHGTAFVSRDREVSKSCRLHWQSDTTCFGFHIPLRQVTLLSSSELKSKRRLLRIREACWNYQSFKSVLGLKLRLPDPSAARRIWSRASSGFTMSSMGDSRRQTPQQRMQVKTKLSQICISASQWYSSLSGARTYRRNNNPYTRLSTQYQHGVLPHLFTLLFRDERGWEQTLSVADKAGCLMNGCKSVF